MTPSTAASYTAIRHRLDHPQVVVWDGCKETLADDDEEWPAPVGEAAMRRLFGRFADAANNVFVLVAAAAVVRTWIQTQQSRGCVSDILEDGCGVPGSEAIFDRDLPLRALLLLEHELRGAPLAPEVPSDLNDIPVCRLDLCASLRERYGEALSTFSFDLESGFGTAEDVDALELALNDLTVDCAYQAVLAAANAEQLKSDPHYRGCPRSRSGCSRLL